MKKLTILKPYLFLFLICYIGCSFIEMNFNSNKWTFNLRLMIVIFYIIISFTFFHS